MTATKKRINIALESELYKEYYSQIFIYLFKQSVIVFISQNSFISSAYSRYLAFNFFATSFIKIINSNGPNTEPCGTHDV